MKLYFTLEMVNYVGMLRYAGVDSDPVWVRMARDKVSSHFRFYLGNVGKTVGWGMPTEHLPKNILNSQLGPLIVEPLPFDVYMVDGRWRLPPHNAIVLIHGCPQTSDGIRSFYKKADHSMTMVQNSGELLCVYMRKAETTDEELKELWHTYMDSLKGNTRTLN